MCVCVCVFGFTSYVRLVREGSVNHPLSVLLKNELVEISLCMCRSSLSPASLFGAEDQFTVAQRAEVTVDERSLTSCVSSFP